MPESTLDDFDRLAFEAALPDLVERLRAGCFGPVVLVWSEDGHGRHLPNAVKLPNEAAPVSLWDTYRAGRLR